MSGMGKNRLEFTPWIAAGLYVLVALIWLVPDRRIERMLSEPPAGGNRCPPPAPSGP